jgi:hypothetical protein
MNNDIVVLTHINMKHTQLSAKNTKLFMEAQAGAHKIKEVIKIIATIYIIIWLSLYVLSVHFPTPPKPAGLDPQNLRRNMFMYMRKNFFWGIFFGFFHMQTTVS